MAAVISADRVNAMYVQSASSNGDVSLESLSSLTRRSCLPLPAVVTAHSLTAATQTEWDRNFLGTGQIATWVKAEIATAPFDPAKKTLLDYVKERMALAETLKKNAALAATKTSTATASSSSNTVQQQQPGLRSHASPQRLLRTPNGQAQPLAVPHAQTGQTYAAADVDAEGSSDGSQEDNAPLEFDMDEYIQPSAVNGNGLPASRSVSPLPSIQSYPHQQQAPAPIASGSEPPAYTQPPAYSQPPPYSQLSHQSVSQGTQPSLNPGYLNPAVLSYSHQVQPQQSLYPQQSLQGSSISPQQLNQAAAHQVNGSQETQRTVYNPHQQQQSRQNQPNKRPRGQEVEVEILVQPRNDSPRNSPLPTSQPSTAKKQKTAPVVGRSPLVASTSNPPQSKKTGKSQAVSGSSQQGSLVASTSSVTPTPPTSGQTESQMLRAQSEEHWRLNLKEIERALSLANNSPNKTVRKLFDRLGVYVTEPEGASTRGERDASVTDLSVPPEGRTLILETIKEETLEDFDTVFVVDPRATVLIADWVKDLALIAKGKSTRNDAMDQAAIKKTGRVTLEVSLDVLGACRPVHHRRLPHHARGGAHLLQSRLDCRAYVRVPSHREAECALLPYPSNAGLHLCLHRPGCAFQILRAGEACCDGTSAAGRAAGAEWSVVYCRSARARQ